jgi:hypothetical protein
MAKIGKLWEKSLPANALFNEPFSFSGVEEAEIH